MARSTKRKVTLLLDEGVVEGLRSAVVAGAADSQSSLVEKAVGDFLAVVKRRQLRMDYESAVKDPAFLEDIRQVGRDFEVPDLDPELDV